MKLRTYDSNYRSMILEMGVASVAAPTAPTKPRPATPKPVKPRPSSPKPSPSPWETPWPSTLPTPRPKARKKKEIKETFERSVNPSTSKFWADLPKNKKHIFGKHPLFAMYGLEKAKRSWQSGVDSLKKLYPEIRNMSNPEVMQRVPMLSQRVFMDLLRIERPHHKQLATLAVDLVHEVWGIPKNMLKAMFSTQPGMDSGSNDPEDEPGEDRSEQLRDQINKRMTMNALTQGAAVQNMMTIHHMAKERLEQIAPELLDIYSKFAAGSHASYWIIDFARLANLADMAIGDVALEKNEDGNVSIKAKAMVFPVLVQELVKGSMEYLSMLGMQDLPPEDVAEVLRHSDKLEYEPWQIQIGPDLWNAFLKVIPRNYPLANVVHKFAGKDPKFINQLLSDTLEAIQRNEDPASQRDILTAMMQELDEFEDDEFEDDEFEDDEFEDDEFEDDEFDDSNWEDDEEYLS